jgi:hypothetical protein
MQGKTTKENFLSMIEIASDGADIIKTINLLPN